MGHLCFIPLVIARNMGAISDIKQSIAENSKQQTILEQQLEFELELATIADSRYESGCLPIVATVYPHKYVTIVQGKVIQDRITPIAQRNCSV